MSFTKTPSFAVTDKVAPVVRTKMSSTATGVGSISLTASATDSLVVIPRALDTVTLN